MIPRLVAGQASHQLTSELSAVRLAAYRIPASSGTGGRPMPVKSIHRKIETYQWNAVKVMAASRGCAERNQGFSGKSCAGGAGKGEKDTPTPTLPRKGGGRK